MKPVLRMTTWALLIGGGAQAQVTYWLATVQKTPTVVNYTFNVKAAEYLVPWLLERTPLGGGQTEERAVNGKNQTFLRQYVTWDTGGSSPARTGQIRIDNNRERWRSNLWKSSEALKQDRAMIAALDASAKPSSNPWREADLLILRWDGPKPPNLRYSEPIPLVEQFRAAQTKLAEQTGPGAFYPGTKVPANLAAFRASMLKIGNLGRSDPEFRKANRFANNFSGPTVRTDQGNEKIVKTNPAPPYFQPLVLNPKLNEACQFQAEYQAQTRRAGHDGPPNFNGKSMRSLGDRLKFFAPEIGAAGEGAGGTEDVSSFPESWMKSETHYRPWFNISGEVRAVGLGVAQGTDSKWYFCMVYGLEPTK